MALRIEVVRAWADRAEVVELRLPEGSTVADALRASGLSADAVGIFGRRVTPARHLADGDRVELYRPLKVDPKEGRRLRATRKAGARRR